MIVTVSGVLLLGAVVIFLCRRAALRISHAVACALFGFLLASSALAPYLREATAAVLRFIAGMHA